MIGGNGLRVSRAQVTPDSAALYDRYAALYAAFRLHVFPDDRRDIARALDLPAAHRLAEIGCGPGFYATAFAAAYPHLAVTGIDRAPAQLAIARRRAQGLTNATFAHGDVRFLGQWRGLFDRIVAARLMMIVPERAQALAQMYRALVPEGRLVLAEPLAPPQVSVLRLMHGFAPSSADRLRDREHIFTAASFVSLVHEHPWAHVAFWENNGHRYACCVK